VSDPDLLMAVPNVSEGANPAVLDTIGAAFSSAPPARLVTAPHADPDHHRAVFTLAGPAEALVRALLAGARATLTHVDLGTPRGLHPHVGAIDVIPIVHLDEARRAAATAAALDLGRRIGEELAVPVLLYGALAGGRTRAELRRGGLTALTQRLAGGELRPDFGPAAPHPSAGAVLVTARAPLVAFNVELAPPATLADARRIAALVREGGAEGLPGVRAIGLALEARGGVAQVSCNVEDHRAVSLADVVAAVARHVPVSEAELVGLAPAAAFAGFPPDVPVRNRATIEDALA
jgi:glutamate formiminotransferase